MHLQDRFRLTGYSMLHENSNLRTSVVGRGALQGLQKGLRSKDTFTMRRSQIILASSRGERAPRIALNLGCASQTVRDAINDFNERGLDALVAKSSRPKKTREAFDRKSAEALREMLHRSAREFGYESSLWTLEMAAEAACERGLTDEQVSGETIRATLSRVLSVRWMRPLGGGSPLPILCTNEKRRRDRLMEIANTNPEWAE